MSLTVGIFSKKAVDPVATLESNIRPYSVHDEPPNLPLGHDAINDASVDCKVCNGGTGCQQVLEAIFSPAFNLSRGHVGETGYEVAFIQKEEQNAQPDIIAFENVELDILSTRVTQLNTEAITTEVENTNQNAMNSLNMMGISNEEVDKNDPDNVSRKNHGRMMHPSNTNVAVSRCDAYVVGSIVLSEISSLHTTMTNSKLEHFDEHDRDSLSKNVCVKNDEAKEFDFYLFMKMLPSLSSLVHTFRPVLLPKRTRSCPATTLVLDLDETLVHSTIEPCNRVDFKFCTKSDLNGRTFHVRFRPYLKYFLEKVSVLLEIIIFTASQSHYAEQILNVVDLNRKYFCHRLYRESCVLIKGKTT